MKDSVTIICCGLMLAAGVMVRNISITPTNTITAQPLNDVVHPIEVHDTITASDTIRDTVPIIKYKTKYKTKRVACTHSDTIVSNTVSNQREVRKGTPPDTLPSKPKWYKVYGTIEPYNSENRL